MSLKGKQKQEDLDLSYQDFDTIGELVHQYFNPL